MLVKISNRLINFYLKRFYPIKWARRIGVKVGEHTLISSDTLFSSEPYLITIGDHVRITRSVSMYTHGGGNVVRRHIPDFDCFGKIIIEDWAYIGSKSLIMPGVTIGEGALVAAGSVVTKSVPPNTVVGGNPAKALCKVNEYLERNMKYNIKTKGLDYHSKKEILQNLSDEMFIKK